MPTMPSLPTRRMRLWSSKSLKSDDSPSSSPVDEHSSAAETGRKIKIDTLGQTDHGEKSNGAAPDEDKRRPLAADIKARKVANERFYTAAEALHSYFGKKKPLPFDLPHVTALEAAMTLDEASDACALTYPASSSLVASAAREGAAAITRNNDKLAPVESLGMAMASIAGTYGKIGKAEASRNNDKLEEANRDGLYLPRNEVLASHLGHLAGVQLALGRAQSEFASTLSSTMLTRLARMQAAIESLRATEKACEAAREKMEAAERKRDRARDKGEAKRELEEDARLTRATFEEAHNDVASRVAMLTETEQHGPGSGVEIIKDYLSLHLEWVNTQQEILSGAQTAIAHYHNEEGTVSTGSKALTAHARTPSSKTSVPPVPKRWDQKVTGAESANVARARPNAPPPLLQQRSTTSIHTVGKVTRSRPPSRGESNDTKADTSSDQRNSFSSAKDARADSAGAARLRSDSLGKFGGRLTSALARSTSSSELPRAGAPLKSERGTSNEKTTSNWSATLLSLKRDPAARTYKSVAGQSDGRMLNGHERDLSHVREGTDQSYESHLPSFDDLNHGVTFGTADETGQHELGPQVDHASLSDVASFVAVNPMRRDSNTSALAVAVPHQSNTLALPNPTLSAQWTGFSGISSDGGDPFGGTSDADPASPHPFTGRSDRLNSIGAPDS